jgi:hypothetical protein
MDFPKVLKELQMLLIKLILMLAQVENQLVAHQVNGFLEKPIVKRFLLL